MSNGSYSKADILSAIRDAAEALGKPPSRAELQAHSGIREYYVLKCFPGWNAAVTAAGLKAHTGNIKLDDSVLLQDWGTLVRELRHIPTVRSTDNTGLTVPVFGEALRSLVEYPFAFSQVRKRRFRMDGCHCFLAIIAVARLSTCAVTNDIGLPQLYLDPGISNANARTTGQPPDVWQPHGLPWPQA